MVVRAKVRSSSSRLALGSGTSPGMLKATWAPRDWRLAVYPARELDEALPLSACAAGVSARAAPDATRHAASTRAGRRRRAPRPWVMGTTSSRAEALVGCAARWWRRDGFRNRRARMRTSPAQVGREQCAAADVGRLPDVHHPSLV